MKKVFILTAICLATHLAAPAYAAEGSAKEIFETQGLEGKTQILFDDSEAFEISSDDVSEVDGGSIHSGNVVITFQGVRMKATSVLAQREEDGKLRLVADRLTLVHFGAD